MVRTFLILLFLSTGVASPPKTIAWVDLEDVEFEEKFSEEIDAYYFYPHFGESVKKLDNVEVSIKGHMLPIDPVKGIYILSRYPYSACFFCGNGGPESIVELEFKGSHRKFKNDEVVSLKGVLKLNQDDMYKCSYILEQVVEIP